jgi:ABC-2 type transport system permease protein
MEKVIKKRSRRSQDLFQLFLSLGIVIFINIISTFVFTRFDLTSEKRYTLSPATKDLLKKLDDVVYVRVYLDGDFPAAFKRLKNASKEMLDEFRAYAGDNLQYEFINPNANNDPKERDKLYKQLMEDGLQPTDLNTNEKGSKSVQRIFPAALFTYKSNVRKFPVQILQTRLIGSPEELLNNSIEALEYQFAKAIKQLTVINKPKIAFIDGQGELDTLTTYDISRYLEDFYVVDRVTIDGQIHSLKDYKAIIIAKPDSAFNEKDKFVIDQYIMHGGKVLWLLDRMRASMDSLNGKPQTVSIDMNLNLEDQLFHYGVKINPTLIQDLSCAPIPVITGRIGSRDKTELEPWYYYPLSFPIINHPIVNNLNGVKFEFASTIDTVRVPDVRKTVLLSSSEFAKVLYTPVLISLNIMRDKPDPKLYTDRFKPLAVLLEGEFTSNYKNRIPKTIAQDSAIDYKARSVPNKMIVVSDGDIIRNHLGKQRGSIIPLGYDISTKQTYGNRDFILNSIDYLCDDSGLITVRSKELKLRLLDTNKVDDERTKWQLINLIAPALFIILFGVIRNYLRKRKYAV